MIAKELINVKIPALKTSDSGLEAMSMMDEYRVSHLPIINNEQLLGIISDEDIISLNHFEEPIGNHKLSLSRIFVSEDQHILEVIRIIGENNLTLLPVLDAKNNYLGVITLRRLVAKFTDILAVSNPGGVLILEMNERDYSLSEIAQIVESNDARILSVFLQTYPDSTKLDIVLKINKMDLSAIISTFNRYDYIIKATFSEGNYDDMLRDRFDSFMSYLNV
ncbi:MAG: CBS domain-containing protein [Bacteroidetes bacterium]|nr:CBS domain-containing protein [Bacteroidota bacterium]